MITSKVIASSKPIGKRATVEALSNGMFRVGRGSHSIVRTLTAEQLAEWEASPLNWTYFEPTPGLGR
jgi:hypothetical protein